MPDTTDARPSTLIPLARDEQGNAIPIPAEAAFWRVRRQTKGRPRNICGVDREQLKLPLDFSAADLHNMLGPGTYRLDLHDSTGASLDVTVSATVGESEPAREPVEVELVPALPNTASDTRLVLEANVRATQMAFLHNERTLASSLRMAETLRDSVSVLAQAQADWIKAVVGSKSFLRNAAPPPVAAVDDDDHDHDDEVDDDGGSSSRESQFLQFGISIATLINNAIEKLGSKSGATTNAGGFDLKSLLDWRRAAPKPTEELARADEKPSATNVGELLKQLPVAVTAKLMEVRTMLTPEEQKRLAPLLLAIPPSELPTVIEELKSRSVDQIVVLVRDSLGTMAKA